MKKRVLPVLLALCLVVSMIPMAFAETSACPGKDNESCTCKDNCTAADHDASACSACQACTVCTPKQGGSEDTDKCANDNCANKATCTVKACTGTCTAASPCAECTKASCGACKEETKPADKCNTGGCTLDKGHTGKHNNTESCSADANCSGAATIKTHTAPCPKAPCDVATCTKGYGHTGAHNNTTCPGTALGAGMCGAAAGTHTGSCNSFSACGFGGCTKDYGHKDDHNNSECQGGVSGSDRCATALTHKLGCPKYTCTGSADVKNCTATSHNGECPKLAALGYCKDMEGCTFSNGHTGPHSVTGRCSGDSRCAWDESDGTKHAATCSKWKCCKTDGCTGKPGCPACNAAAGEGVTCDCDNCKPAATVTPSTPGSNTPAATAPDTLTAGVKPTDPEPTPSTPVDPTPSTPTVSDFSDMAGAADWKVQGVSKALEQGWMVGNSDGTFKPDDPTNGNMAVVVISRIMEKGFVTTGSTWAVEATAWAASEGISAGIEIGSGEISRQDLITMLWRAAGSEDVEVDLSGWTDAADVADYAKTAMAWAVREGILLGNGDNTLTPNTALTRAMLCTFLSRYLDK